MDKAVAGDSKRAVIYARQSISRDPIDSLSIEFQQRECSEYIARQGWILVGAYSDPDKKGWRRYRPAFDEMLATVAAGKADVVVLYKLSRFARNLMMQEEVVAEIAEANGELVSITEPHMSTSPMIRQILGAVNEHFRRDQADWISSAMTAKARRGHHLGYPPFGYRMTDHRLQVDDVTGPIASEVWEWALAGHGTPEITFRLNERGVLTLRGNKWHHSSVYAMLTNPTYAGSVRNRGEIVATDAHPAIVTQGEYDQVQQLIGRRSKHRRKAAPSWAEGFVFHGCGRRMYLNGAKTSRGDSPKWRARFRCDHSAPKQSRGEVRCTHRPSTIYVDYAEAAIVDGLADLVTRLQTPERITAELDRAYGTTAAKRDRHRSSLQRKLDDLTRQRDRLLSLVLEGKVDADLYRERDDALKAEIAVVADELSAVPAPVSLDEVRKRHTALVGLFSSIDIVSLEREAIVSVLAGLDAKLIVGDGDPYLRVGDHLASFFTPSGG